jgi:hypothetical protein
VTYKNLLASIAAAGLSGPAGAEPANPLNISDHVARDMTCAAYMAAIEDGPHHDPAQRHATLIVVLADAFIGGVALAEGREHGDVAVRVMLNCMTNPDKTLRAAAMNKN